MLRMGKMTDYATVVLASLAQEPAGIGPRLNWPSGLA
jgi:hypothetical protein